MLYIMSCEQGIFEKKKNVVDFSTVVAANLHIISSMHVVITLTMVNVVGHTNNKNSL